MPPKTWMLWCSSFNPCGGNTSRCSDSSNLLSSVVPKDAGVYTIWAHPLAPIHSAVTMADIRLLAGGMLGMSIRFVESVTSVVAVPMVAASARASVSASSLAAASAADVEPALRQPPHRDVLGQALSVVGRAHPMDRGQAAAQQRHDPWRGPRRRRPRLLIHGPPTRQRVHVGGESTPQSVRAERVHHHEQDIWRRLRRRPCTRQQKQDHASSIEPDTSRVSRWRSLRTPARQKERPAAPPRDVPCS